MINYPTTNSYGEEYWKRKLSFFSPTLVGGGHPSVGAPIPRKISVYVDKIKLRNEQVFGQMLCD
jgi:hypothetical protein